MKYRLLFLCTGNSCRSQMAEGWTRRLWPDVFDVHSAGIFAHGLNQKAVQVMAEKDIDISGHTSKTLKDLPQAPFDFVITVCGHAAESCPIFPGQTKKSHQGFEDPPKLAENLKSEEEALNHYRKVRDEIGEFVKTLPNFLHIQSNKFKKQNLLVIFLFICVAFLVQPVVAGPTRGIGTLGITGALGKASRENKFVFLLVSDKEDEATAAVKKTVEATVQKIADREYPSRQELIDALDVPIENESSVRYSPEVAELVAIGASVASNCSACFRFHHDKAEKLGVSRETIAQAVNTAIAVKKASDDKIMALADKTLFGNDNPKGPVANECCGPSQPTKKFHLMGSDLLGVEALRAFSQNRPMTVRALKS